MISHTNRPRRARCKRFALLMVVAALMVSLVSFAAESDSVAQECSEGSVPSENGVSCELDVSSNNDICPEGQDLDSAGLFC
jgi:hypothetical protein